jgi:hypothetical protein
LFEKFANRFKGLPQQLRARRIKFVRTSQERVWRSRAQVHDHLWHSRAKTLATGAALFARGTQWPVFGRLAKRGEARLHARLERFVTPKLEGFAELNAKRLVSAIRDIDSRSELLAIRHQEQINKARKTVLASLDRAFTRLEALPAPAPTMVPVPA